MTMIMPKVTRQQYSGGVTIPNIGDSDPREEPKETQPISQTHQPKQEPIKPTPKPNQQETIQPKQPEPKEEPTEPVEPPSVSFEEISFDTGVEESAPTVEIGKQPTFTVDEPTDTSGGLYNNTTGVRNTNPSNNNVGLKDSSSNQLTTTPTHSEGISIHITGDRNTVTISRPNELEEGNSKTALTLESILGVSDLETLTEIETEVKYMQKVIDAKKTIFEAERKVNS